MKAASLNEIKKELNHLPELELRELFMRLIRYKKENKELLSYLLFEAHDESAFINKVKEEIDLYFVDLYGINLHNSKKVLRKILRFVNKYIKYSGIKQTEVELLIHFNFRMKTQGLSKTDNRMINNLYDKQILKIYKAISFLHEDLQYDYSRETKELIEER